MEKEHESINSCKHKIMAIDDAMYVLGGKWKIHIIAALCFGEKRFSDLLSAITGISGKMLSRELKDMETNLLVIRRIEATRPLKVNYELTEYGKKLIPLINDLAEWGMAHRKEIRK
ncbi:winged helix-turn-helix transcriptional regulator [Dyadobacter tibetensis]|uniref:winged helix-turn-helix transcriptional regulator n=1 Tax=Dyadobacter tibetensis TaxID=1211851 RepID=UPI0004715F61|nr:helix-turn-helix domain-containing protein [Dyadobacter tibetensis]